ncbi:MAG: hypothetical protein B6I20_08065 [Bacteroidetes bacterium 4572_117]|nr:MAG: hypothetical protein B6I20_08065 [Bacteroidetes bacterium 4572_117]
MKRLDKIPFNKLIWLIPIVYLLHELEEWYIFEWWSNVFPDSAPLPEFAGRVWLLASSAFGFILIGLFSYFMNPKTVAISSLILASLPFANGLQHLYWLFYFSTYTPGVIFASFIGIPVTIYIAWRAISENLIKKRFILLLLIFPIYIFHEVIMAGDQVPNSMKILIEFISSF